MPSNPLSIEESTNKIGTAWETLAPTATFAGMTLTQYKDKVKPSADRRAEIAALESQRTAAINQREAADKTTLETNQKVVKAVAGDINFGDDSDLYEAMGYVRKSERKSGLSRNKQTPAPTP